MENAPENTSECTSQVSDNNYSKNFYLRDCALISIATGLNAQNLREFRDGLRKVETGSIYHHFWGRLLQPQFDEPEYNNDFASWAAHGLHDKALAERLSVVDPTGFPDTEALREELIDIVENRLDESEVVPWARSDARFYFVRSQIVIFDTGKVLEAPCKLAEEAPNLSEGSIFYHFIDARRRTDAHCDDFSAWLEFFGDDYRALIEDLRAVDPYFSSLWELRDILTDIFREHFGGGAW